MSERSLRTRSEVSASSRASETRQKAALAQLRLSQVRLANQIEQQEMVRQHELEVQLEQQMRELEKYKMETERGRKLRDLAFEVEQCELQVRHEEENELAALSNNELIPEAKTEEKPETKPEAKPEGET